MLEVFIRSTSLIVTVSFSLSFCIIFLPKLGGVLATCIMEILLLRLLLVLFLKITQGLFQIHHVCMTYINFLKHFLCWTYANIFRSYSSSYLYRSRTLEISPSGKIVSGTTEVVHQYEIFSSLMFVYLCKLYFNFPFYFLLFFPLQCILLSYTGFIYVYLFFVLNKEEDNSHQLLYA